MMASSHDNEKKNNLELYLNDVYENECMFRIEQEEIDFIKTGIETVVQKLVEHILSDEVAAKIQHYFSLVEDHSNYIAAAYFPIEKDSPLHRYATDGYIKTKKATIIKVGSFYDGTKINFPDEFDFIFPILDCTDPRYELFLPSVNSGIITAVKNVRHSLFNYDNHIEKHQVSRKLEMNELMEEHGPAIKYQFTYSNGFGQQRYIHVDLVPAYRIVNSNTQEWFVEDVNVKQLKTFCEEVLSARSCLFVNVDIAYTETEKHFMTNILSKRHVKVHRILKYLLNGHGDGEELEMYFKYKDKPHISSYCIKTLMIYHHDNCTTTDTEDIGSCVLQVLEKLNECAETGAFLTFYIKSYFEEYPVKPYLESTIKILGSMQTSEASYDYDRDKIKSVSRKYLDSTLDSLDQSTGDQKKYPCCDIL